MKVKELYQAPATTVVEVKFDGIVCQLSGGDQATIPGYGDALEI